MAASGPRAVVHRSLLRVLAPHPAAGRAELPGRPAPSAAGAAPPPLCAALAARADAAPRAADAPPRCLVGAAAPEVRALSPALLARAPPNSPLQLKKRAAGA
jgi:hypothetical protein